MQNPQNTKKKKTFVKSLREICESSILFCSDETEALGCRLSTNMAACRPSENQPRQIHESRRRATACDHQKVRLRTDLLNVLPLYSPLPSTVNRCTYYSWRPIVYCDRGLAGTTLETGWGLPLNWSLAELRFSASNATNSSSTPTSTSSNIRSMLLIRKSCSYELFLKVVLPLS